MKSLLRKFGWIAFVFSVAASCAAIITLAATGGL